MEIKIGHIIRFYPEFEHKYAYPYLFSRTYYKFADGWELITDIFEET